jgi:hypothetical protein
MGGDIRELSVILHNAHHCYCLTEFSEMLMDIPHRYDLEQTLCVNKEVEKYNRRLRKHMKVCEI